MGCDQVLCYFQLERKNGLFYYLNLTSSVRSVLLANNTYLPDPRRFFNIFHRQNPVNRGFGGYLSTAQRRQGRRRTIRQRLANAVPPPGGINSTLAGFRLQIYLLKVTKFGYVYNRFLPPPFHAPKPLGGPVAFAPLGVLPNPSKPQPSGRKIHAD